jgi:hypothetical protein
LHTKRIGFRRWSKILSIWLEGFDGNNEYFGRA